VNFKELSSEQKIHLRLYRYSNGLQDDVIEIEKPAELRFSYGIHVGLIRFVTAVACHCRKV